MNQTEFAELAGVLKGAQVNYEAGKRAPDTNYITAIAAAGADVLYILLGHHDPAVPKLDGAEQVLLDSYRRCKPDGRTHLIQTAALLSAGLPVPRGAGKTAAAPRAGTGGVSMSNTAKGGVQVGFAGGNVNVGKRK